MNHSRYFIIYFTAMYIIDTYFTYFRDSEIQFKTKSTFKTTIKNNKNITEQKKNAIKNFSSRILFR